SCCSCGDPFILVFTEDINYADDLKLSYADNLRSSAYDSSYADMQHILL
ncbi:unnamed protein product, partial [Brachionus calyciflorus]